MRLDRFFATAAIALVAVSGPGVAEAKPLQVRALRLDADFPVQSLPTAGPDFRVRDFVVVEDRIFYAERTLPSQRPREHYVREMPTHGRGASSVAIPNCELYSLSANGSELMFFDFVQQQMASYDVATRRLEFLGPTPGYHSLQRFRNGNIIATLEATGLLDEHGALSEEQIRDMRGIMTQEALQKALLERHARAAELGVYDTVLLGPDLRVKRPLLYAFDHTKLNEAGRDDRNPVQRALARRLVRVSPDRSLAAVFSIDRPGIMLFDENGELVATIASPGQGTILPPDNPYAGEHVLYQSDVVVGDDHLLVVDNPGKRLWALDLNGREITSFEEPFVILEAERSGQYLYVRGCSRPFPGAADCAAEGRFARYYYPQLPGSRYGLAAEDR